MAVMPCRSASLDDLTETVVGQGWLGRDPRAAKLMTIEHDGFIDEADNFTEEDYKTLPIFTEVMKQSAMGSEHPPGSIHPAMSASCLPSRRRSPPGGLRKMRSPI